MSPGQAGLVEEELAVADANALLETVAATEEAEEDEEEALAKELELDELAVAVEPARRERRGVREREVGAAWALVVHANSISATAVAPNRGSCWRCSPVMDTCPPRHDQRLQTAPARTWHRTSRQGISQRGVGLVHVIALLFAPLLCGGRVLGWVPAGVLCAWGWGLAGRVAVSWRRRLVGLVVAGHGA